MILGQVRIEADGSFTSSFDSTALPPGGYELGVTTAPNVRPLAVAVFTVTEPATPVAGTPSTGSGPAQDG